jgi:hypothetical protein
MQRLVVARHAAPRQVQPYSAEGQHRRIDVCAGEQR